MTLDIRLRAGPDDQYIAAFPFHPELVAAVKAIPGRRFDARHQHWLIPATPEAIETLKANMPPGGRVLATEDVQRRHAEATAALAHAAAAKRRGDSDITYDYLTTPYAHQRAGLEFLARLGSGALLWEMGTGKTKTAIDYAEWLARGSWREAEPIPNAAHFRGTLVDESRFRVLVVCPNTVKRNWGAEIEKHAGHQGYDVLDGTIPERIRRMGKCRYTIVNCEALSIPAFAKAAAELSWDMVIVDESTRFKSQNAARTKALHRLKADRRVILTGTPITGKPEDAWAQMHFVAPGLLGSYWHFRDRYIALDFFKHPVGLKAGMAPELNKLITSRSYRVLKQDVLDLPPKVYEDRVVELAGVQKLAYEQMKRDLLVQIEGMEQATAFNILTVLLRLTQITAGMVGGGDTYTWMDKGNAKLAELDDLLNDELRGEQVVVFGTYQRELERLALRYQGPSTGDDTWDLPPIIYGPTPEKRRAELIDQFQQGRRRLLFVQTHTGGIGINLTAASTAIYYTRGWSLEDYLQSQDRLHRIGQTRSVTIVHLIAKGTVDEEIAKALAKKQNLADQLTGDDARRLARGLLGGKK